MAIATPQPYTVAAVHDSAQLPHLGGHVEVYAHQTAGRGSVQRSLWSWRFAALFADVIAPYDAYELNQKPAVPRPDFDALAGD